MLSAADTEQSHTWIELSVLSFEIKVSISSNLKVILNIF